MHFTLLQNFLKLMTEGNRKAIHFISQNCCSIYLNSSTTRSEGKKSHFNQAYVGLSLPAPHLYIISVTFSLPMNLTWELMNLPLQCLKEHKRAAVYSQSHSRSQAIGMNVLSRSQQSLKNTVSQRYLLPHAWCAPVFGRIRLVAPWTFTIIRQPTECLLILSFVS